MRKMGKFEEEEEDGGRGGGMFTRPDISRSGLWGTAEKRDTNIGLKN